jgi:hypothetical protein
MKGFAVSNDTIEDSVKMLSISAQDPMLPVVELEEALSTLSGRLPGPLANAMNKLCSEFRSAVSNSQNEIDAVAEKDRLDAIPVLFQMHTSHLPPREVATMRTNASVLLELPQRFGSKSAPRLVQEIVRLLSEYVRVERLSGDKKMRSDERFKMLRENSTISTNDLYSIGLAHLSSKRRERLVEMLLKRLAPEQGEKLSDQSESVVTSVLREIASLMVLTPLSLKARQILLRQKLPSYGEHLRNVERLLRSKHFDSLIESNFDESAPILDLCYDNELRNSALEAYIRCVYRPYVVGVLSFSIYLSLSLPPIHPPIHTNTHNNTDTNFLT